MSCYQGHRAHNLYFEKSYVLKNVIQRLFMILCNNFVYSLHIAAITAGFFLQLFVTSLFPYWSCLNFTNLKTLHLSIYIMSDVLFPTMKIQIQKLQIKIVQSWKLNQLIKTIKFQNVNMKEQHQIVQCLCPSNTHSSSGSRTNTIAHSIYKFTKYPPYY